MTKAARWTRRKNPEHAEQVALIDWCNLASNKYPELRWIHAIPNGGKRNVITAMKLKAEGVKSGVFDLFLPAARRGFHGLYIEMKAGANTLTDSQKDFRGFVATQGFQHGVFWDWLSARDFIIKYLELK